MADYTTNAIQAGDVLMFHVDDRGEISEENGFIEMTVSFFTMIYLCLFGGNEDDDGSEATALLQWWGNEDEPKENQYRSKFQALLKGVPLTSSSVTTLAEAATEDLERGFVATGYAESVTVSAVILVNPKRVRVEGFITLSPENVIPFAVEGDTK